VDARVRVCAAAYDLGDLVFFVDPAEENYTVVSVAVVRDSGFWVSGFDICKKPISRSDSVY